MVKRVIVFLLIVCLFGACQPTSDDRAIDLILHYCDTHYKNYQPVGFEKPRQYYVPYELSSQYLTYNLQKQQLRQQKDSLCKLINKQHKPVYGLKADSISVKIADIDKNIIINKQNYKPVPRGFMVLHWYNQKSTMGHTVRSNTMFIVDDNFKHVLETYEK